MLDLQKKTQNPNAEIMEHLKPASRKAKKKTPNFWSDQLDARTSVVLWLIGTTAQ